MTLFLRYTSCSEITQLAMTDLHSLKRPLAQKFNKKNDIHPFEDPSSLEFFSEKNDTSLMVYGSHSKKRPNCMTLVRLFDHKILDMLELHVEPETFRTLSQFKNTKARVGLKPLVSFSGTAFESPTANAYTLAKSLFLDFFKGEDTNNVDVEGLQYMVHISVAEEVDNQPAPKIQLRCYMIKTKKSGQSLPRVEVEEMGPRIDFRVGRVKEADEDMMKEALKKPKNLEVSRYRHVNLWTAHTNGFTGQDKEEHRDRYYGRQGRPHPLGQAGSQGAADQEDEGSEAQQRRSRRRCIGQRGRGWRCRYQEDSRLSAQLLILIVMLLESSCVLAWRWGISLCKILSYQAIKKVFRTSTFEFGSLCNWPSVASL